MPRAAALRRLVSVDAKLIARDRFLLGMSGLSVLMAIGFRYLIPAATQSLRASLGFDLTPYYPLLGSFVLVSIGAPVLLGMVLGFVLVEAREENTLKALMVTPFSLDGYICYRALTPIVLGLLLAPAAILIVGVAVPPPAALAALSLVASIMAGVFTLFLPAFADNKVQAFAVMKLFGGTAWIPIAAYFVKEPWQFVAGVFPPYWVYKAFWATAAGQASWPLYLGIGALTLTLSLWSLGRRFRAVARR